jgi:ABC-2 type transport system permease protein
MAMKTLRDTWLLFERSMSLTVRNPVWVVIGIAQPLYFLVLFGPLLEPLAGAPGFPPGPPLNVFVPGLLIQLGLFGAGFVGFGLIAEVRNGVIERLRVTPVSRLALLLGRALRDVVVLVVQAILLVACAVPFGLRPNLVGLVVMLGLLVLLGLLMVSVSYTLALWLRNEDALAPLLNTVTLPLLLLSGVLLPLSLAPGWLQAAALLNPLSHAVEAARALFNQQLGDPSIPRALAILGVLAFAARALASRSFNRAAA